MIKSKVLFIHKPKTAGTYISNYFRSAVKNLLPLIYLDGWMYKARDWNDDELAYMAKTDLYKCVDLVLHQHSNFLPEIQFKELKNNGWWSFMFMREPQDIMTSWYHFLNDIPPNSAAYQTPAWQAAKNLTLDQFICHLFVYDEVWSLPSYWEEIDWIGLPTEANFEELFGLIGMQYVKRDKSNTSTNKGYQYYRESGEISDKTHETLIATDQYILQNEIIEKLQNSPK